MRTQLPTSHGIAADILLRVAGVPVVPKAIIEVVFGAGRYLVFEGICEIGHVLPGGPCAGKYLSHRENIHKITEHMYCPDQRELLKMVYDYEEAYGVVLAVDGDFVSSYDFTEWMRYYMTPAGWVDHHDDKTSSRWDEMISAFDPSHDHDWDDGYVHDDDDEHDNDEDDDHDHRHAYNAPDDEGYGNYYGDPDRFSELFPHVENRMSLYHKCIGFKASVYLTAYDVLTSYAQCQDPSDPACTAPEDTVSLANGAMSQIMRKDLNAAASYVVQRLMSTVPDALRLPAHVEGRIYGMLRAIREDDVIMFMDTMTALVNGSSLPLDGPRLAVRVMLAATSAPENRGGIPTAAETAPTAYDKPSKPWLATPDMSLQPFIFAMASLVSDGLDATRAIDGSYGDEARIELGKGHGVYYSINNPNSTAYKIIAALDANKKGLAIDILVKKLTEPPDGSEPSCGAHENCRPDPLPPGGYLEDWVSCKALRWRDDPANPKPWGQTHGPDRNY